MKRLNTACLQGQTLSEYGLGIGLVVLLALGSLMALGDSLSGAWQNMLPKAPSNVALTADPGKPAPAGGELASSPADATGSTEAPGQGNIPAKACTSGGVCIDVSLQPYNAAQVAGANGIDMVDYYTSIIKQIADAAKSDPNASDTFRLMLDDLVEDGHGVAGDERSVLTIRAEYTPEGQGFNFDIEDRYTFTKDRALNYLAEHPGEMSPEMTQVLKTAAHNINQQMTDFIGSGNRSTLTTGNINSKFTDAGGGNGATYVDEQASTMCATGGKNCW